MKHSFGITFSGGGVKGLVHAGVLQALEENSLKPDCISGTSAGAMVGALYASGMKPEKILKLLNSTEIFSFKNFSFREPGFFSISAIEEQLKKNISARTFEELPIEFHAIATDLENAGSKTFSSGELIPAILASSAFPMVFTPIEIGGKLYSDGGITNNFPVNVIRDKCKFLLGVYASPLYEIERKKLSNSIKIADRVYHIAINYASSLKFEVCDTIINPKGLEQYGTFELDKAEKIFEIGYKTANEKMSRIKEAIDGGNLNSFQRFFRKF